MKYSVAKGLSTEANMPHSLDYDAIGAALGKWTQIGHGEQLVKGTLYQKSQSENIHWTWEIIRRWHS
jgi:hypothetical protein